MKHQLFISYSDYDKEKVSLIVDELNGHETFEPLVIASNREALKPLVKKVSEGIEKCVVVIPILTKQSILTQWINQEVGYSMALKKITKPLVEKSIISELKGFIHKQVDLPYTFDTDHNNGKDDFLRAFRDLLLDLESEFTKSSTNELNETSFEKTLKLADQLNAKKRFEQKKLEIVNSQEFSGQVRSEILRMFDQIKQRIDQLKEKGINFGTEEDKNDLLFVFKSNGYSCSFSYMLPYMNTLDDAELFVKYWRGNFNSNKNATYFPGNEPKEIEVKRLTVDLNLKYEIVWSEKDSFKTSDQLVDDAFDWLFSNIDK